MARRKAVVSAETAALVDVERLVDQGRYPSVSAFVREAMAEKLARLRRVRLAEQVARYCGAADPREHDDLEDLIKAQAFPTGREDADR